MENWEKEVKAEYAAKKNRKENLMDSNINISLSHNTISALA